MIGVSNTRLKMMIEACEIVKVGFEVIIAYAGGEFYLKIVLACLECKLIIVVNCGRIQEQFVVEQMIPAQSGSAVSPGYIGIKGAAAALEVQSPATE